MIAILIRKANNLETYKILAKKSKQNDIIIRVTDILKY